MVEVFIAHGSEGLFKVGPRFSFKVFDSKEANANTGQLKGVGLGAWKKKYIFQFALHIKIEKPG